MKILFNPIDSEGSGCQRIIYPLQALTSKDFEFEILRSAGIASQLDTADLVLLQCLIGPQQHQLIQYIKDQGKKIIIDYDDDFSHLPDNMLKKIGMSQDEILSNWVRYLQAADLITVTTEMLARRVRSLTNSFVKVLPNLIRRKDICPDYEPFEDMEEIRIIYSCSESHEDDFKFVVPILKRLGEAYPQVKIISHGGLDFGYHCPWYKGKSKHLSKVSYNSYYKFLQELKPHIFIAPLLATPHNVSRSDLKYLQAGALKAAFVGSDLEPYASLRGKSSAILTDFKIGWWWQLRKLIRNPSLAKKMGQKAFEDVRDNFILEDHIGLWEKTLTSLRESNNV